MPSARGCCGSIPKADVHVVESAHPSVTECDVALVDVRAALRKEGYKVYGGSASSEPLAAAELARNGDWNEAETTLKKGGRVLYMPRKADLDWTSPPLDWVPVFWNRLMNPAWARMLGNDAGNPKQSGRKYSALVLPNSFLKYSFP